MAIGTASNSINPSPLVFQYLDPPQATGRYAGDK